MDLKFKSLLLSILVCFPLAAFETLPDSILERLSAGEDLILETQEVSGASWPKITAYLLIDAPALNSMALFAAYDDQKNYVPNVIVSKPIKERGPLSVDIQYELNLPWPIPNSKYTHGHLIEKKEDEQIYQIKWWMIESTSASDVQGSATFFKHEQKTVMKYISLVTPTSSFASLLEKTMLKDVEQTLREIRKYIEENHQQKSEKNQKYVSILEQTLRGESYWKTLID